MHKPIAAFALLIVASLVASCATAAAPPHRFIVMMMDGMEMAVVDKLQAQGALPSLAMIRKRGPEAKLATDYGAKSPIVWTTVVTGVNADRHGINAFAVDVPGGRTGVSSTMRKVPALWNMVSSRGRSVAVLGPWATWPAEEVNGVVVTDHAATDPKGKRVVFPAELAAELAKAHADRSLFPGEKHVEPQDRVSSYFLLKDLKFGFDLTLAYLRGIDVVSHEYWRYYDGSAFGPPDPERQRLYGDVIPKKYKVMDTIIGRVLAGVPDANLLVISDHGFTNVGKEFAMVSLRISEPLAAMGLLVPLADGKPDMARSKLVPHRVFDNLAENYVRVPLAGREAGATTAAAELPQVRATVTARLAEITWSDGSPVFRVRDLNDKERADPLTSGADFVVVVLGTNASQDVVWKGSRYSTWVKDLTFRSGYHTNAQSGVFFACGPDIDPAAQLAGIRIHDITPTVLYGMGLPVADDFDGKAWPQLYTPAFQAANPMQRIPSWGTTSATGPTTSTTDDEQMEMLKKLGYIE